MEIIVSRKRYMSTEKEQYLLAFFCQNQDVRLYPALDGK